MRRIVPLLVGLQLLMLLGCTSIDCPLNSTVVCKYVLAGPVNKLADTLTVTTRNETTGDPVKLNKLVGAADFTLQLSHNHPVDVLVFALTNSSSVTIRDTVRIYKQDQPHFESVDCPASFFHTLTSAEWTTHAIDSIIITKSKVNYDTTGGNIRIYFKSRD